LSLGIDEGLHHEYGQELDDFVQALAKTEQLGQSLYSPVYPKDFRGQLLEKVLAKTDLRPVLNNFIKLLHDRSRLDLLAEINSAYRDLLDQVDGLIRGTLTTASPLKESEISAVKGALGTLTGRAVELTVVHDPAIIGGLVARLGDLVVDSSLRTQLDKLSRILTT
jgi:F-type H+-transporting ATPase subunit delta